MQKRKTIEIRHVGSLKRKGYSPNSSVLTRHRALGKAVKAYGYKKTMAKLNALRVLNRHNKYGRIYERDVNWLRRYYR